MKLGSCDNNLLINYNERCVLHTKTLAEKAKLEHPKHKAEKAEGNCHLYEYIKIHMRIVVHCIPAVKYLDIDTQRHHEEGDCSCNQGQDACKDFQMTHHLQNESKYITLK